VAQLWAEEAAIGVFIALILLASFSCRFMAN